MDEITLDVIGIEDLRRNKKVSGRLKDIDDFGKFKRFRLIDQ